jgi:hypothetical protein
MHVSHKPVSAIHSCQACFYFCDVDMLLKRGIMHVMTQQRRSETARQVLELLADNKSVIENSS